MSFDREIFFDKIRAKPFGGTLTQQQVDGMNFILDVWEDQYEGEDLRWLANPLAQTYHETGGKMWPIEEYQKGGSAAYAKPDPKTGQCYYGRGFVQITWAENYQRADNELGLSGESSCYLHADKQLDPEISAATMFRGMMEGWFRTADGTPNTLEKYFNDTKNDVYNAREIINGDKSKIPSWSNGVSIGNLIVGYHNAFLTALHAAYQAETGEAVVLVHISAPPGIRVEVHIEEEG